MSKLTLESIQNFQDKLPLKLRKKIKMLMLEKGFIDEKIVLLMTLEQAYSIV